MSKSFSHICDKDVNILFDLSISTSIFFLELALIDLCQMFKCAVFLMNWWPHKGIINEIYS